MPQNKAFKNIALLVCAITFGFSACENKSEPTIPIVTQSFVKTAYTFDDRVAEAAESLKGADRFKQGVALYTEELGAYLQEQNWEGVVYSFDRLGYYYRRDGEDSLSNVSFREGIRLAKTHLPENHMLLSKTYSNLAIKAFFKANYELTISFLDSAYSTYNQSGHYEKSLENRILSYNYYAYSRTGINYDSAIKYLDIRRANDTLIEYELFADYSLTYRNIGDYQSAIAYGQEAYKIALDNVDDEDVRTIENVLEAQFNIGAAYYEASDYKNTVLISEELLNFYSEKEIDRQDRLIASLNLSAIGLQYLNDFSNASNQLIRIINIMEEDNLINEDYWSVVMNLGLNYYREGKFDEGEKLLFQSLRENQKLHGKLHPNNVARYRSLGLYMAFVDEHENALAFYDSAMRSAIPDYYEDVIELPSAKKIDLTYEQLLVVKRKLLEFMEVYELSSDIKLLKAILEYADFVHSILIQNRESYEASEGKLFLSEDFKDMYATAIEANYILYSQSSVEQERFKYANNVSQLMNRSKAVLFLEQSGEYELVRNADISREVKEEYYLLLNKLDSLDEAFYRQTADLATSDSIRIINSERMSVNANLTSLKEMVFSDTLEGENSGIFQPQEYFEKHNKTAVVEYFVFENAIHYLAFFDDNIKLYKTESDDQFKTEFKSLLEEISNKPSFSSNRESFEKFRADAYSMQDKLLGKVLLDLKGQKSRLVIVPDDYLSKLPFEVLLKSENAKSYFDADFLIKEFEISYSLRTDLININSVKKRANNKMIGFGYSGETAVESRSPLGALPGAIEEINFLRENIKGNYYVGAAGSKSNFLSSVKDYDIIHLAIHGISDSTDRYNSRLIFNGRDNVLQTKDIYLANMNSRLVVLSACESGVGEINEGEGTFSIARGFALTGTESIVMSLWKVDDGSSAKLMVDFYKGINKKQTVSTALINSKKTYLLNADRYSSHPYYWSSFVMLGDDINLSSNGQSYWVYVLIVFLLAASWMAIKKKRAN